MDTRGFVWNYCMDGYVFVWTCMEVFVWILVVPFLGFS